MPGTDFVQELNGRFNQIYATQDWAEPHYRAGYLLSKRRSIADLEAVRVSFGSAGQRADLQSCAGVLSALPDYCPERARDCRQRQAHP